jgi:hypothetical protein
MRDSLQRPPAEARQLPRSASMPGRSRYGSSIKWRTSSAALDSKYVPGLARRPPDASHSALKSRVEYARTARTFEVSMWTEEASMWTEGTDSQPPLTFVSTSARGAGRGRPRTTNGQGRTSGRGGSSWPQLSKLDPRRVGAADPTAAETDVHSASADDVTLPESVAQSGRRADCKHSGGHVWVIS